MAIDDGDFSLLFLFLLVLNTTLHSAMILHSMRRYEAKAQYYIGRPKSQLTTLWNEVLSTLFSRWSCDFLGGNGGGTSSSDAT